MRAKALATLRYNVQSLPPIQQSVICMITVIHALTRRMDPMHRSSTMTEGKIVSWLKNVGDKVAKGEPIVVVESDKGACQAHRPADC